MNEVAAETARKVARDLAPEALASLLAQLHPTQAAHAVAAAALDSARVALYERTRGLPTSTEAELEAWDEACEAARAELEIGALDDALIAAEDALLRWSFAVARRSISDTYRELPKVRARALGLVLDIEARCFGSAPHRFRSLEARRRATDIALRLDPAALT